jgi:hypothetical protein
MNPVDNRVGIGATTTRVEISGNYIRHNAQLSNILATPNVTMLQNNTGANIEIFEGTTTATTKNATLTVTRTSGTSTKFYTEDVQSNTNLRVGQGFLGGNNTGVTNTYGLQYGANNSVTPGIYMNSEGVGINTRQNLVAGAALTVNGQIQLSNTGYPYVSMVQIVIQIILLPLFNLIARPMYKVPFWVIQTLPRMIFRFVPRLMVEISYFVPIATILVPFLFRM